MRCATTTTSSRRRRCSALPTRSSARRSPRSTRRSPTLEASGETDRDAIQNAVYEVGRSFERYQDKGKTGPDGRPGVALTWFATLYQILLGLERGPRFGSFVAIYGIPETRALIARALAGELVACHDRVARKGTDRARSLAEDGEAREALRISDEQLAEVRRRRSAKDQKFLSFEEVRKRLLPAGK